MVIFHGSPGPFKGQGGVIECCCNSQLVPDDPESIAEHATEHAKWMHAVGTHGRAPVSFAERERMKDDGRRKRHHGATVAERLMGAEEELCGYYHRSFDEAIKRGFGFKHPTEIEFLRMAGEDDLLGDTEISDLLCAKYEFVRRPGGRLAYGSWEL